MKKIQKMTNATLVEAKVQQDKGMHSFEEIITSSLKSEMNELEKLALNGDSDAAYHLANLYYLEPKVRDIKKGWKFLIHAAGLGHMSAEADIGTIYYRIAKTKQTKKVVFDWFKSAAKHGHPESMMVLSHFYQEGYGCKRDLGKSIIWEEHAKYNNYDKTVYLHMLGLD